MGYKIVFFKAIKKRQGRLPLNLLSIDITSESRRKGMRQETEQEEQKEELTSNAGVLTSMWLTTWSSRLTLWSGTLGRSKTALTQYWILPYFPVKEVTKGLEQTRDIHLWVHFPTKPKKPGLKGGLRLKTQEEAGMSVVAAIQNQSADFTGRR